MAAAKDPNGADIAAVEPGVYSVLQDGRSYEARVEQSDGGVAVFDQQIRLDR